MQMLSMMSARLIHISRLPLYGCRCHRAGLISHTHVQYSSDLVHVGRRKPITSTHAVSFSSDLASRKYSLIYTFPAIKGLRALSRLKLMQTGITVVLLPTVYYLYLQGQASVMLLSYSTGIAVFVSHLTFWGHRRDIYVPVSDVMTLGESGDAKGEPILCLKRYSRSDTMYFSTRLGRVVDKNAFEKVFGSLS
uniref:Transmembrane protein 186 n=1 Tax=Sinocyclocheilus anshuiensis TaxID=1608454 RepID=A0A671KYH3_9TELE